MTVRLSDDVEELLRLGAEATGHSRNELINEALRAVGPSLLERLIRQRREAIAVWEKKKLGGDAGKGAPGEKS